MKQIVLLAPVILAGCTSSYEGIRLPSSGNYRELSLEQTVGVPFTLTKPEFTIKRVEGSNPERFDISVAYVPDSEQRYALRMKPTWLSKIDFNMAMGPGGGLTSSSVDVTDQAVPFVTAVIKLAASVATTAAAFSPADRKPGLAGCLELKGAGALAACAVDESHTSHKCSDEAYQAITARLEHALIGDKDDKGAALTTLFARSANEASCYKDAATTLAQALKTKSDGLGTAFTNAAKPPLVPGPDDQGHLAPVAVLVAQAQAVLLEVADKGDTTKARKLVYATDLAVKGQGSYLRALLTLPTDPSLADAQTLATLLSKIGMASGSGAEPIQQIALGAKVQSALAGIETMSAGQWRARYIPVLQYEQAAAERDALVATKPAEIKKARARAEQARKSLAAMVNMSAEYARLAQIDAILDAVPKLQAASRQSSIDQYQGYVKQASDIRTEMATRLAAAVATEQAKKQDAVLPVSLPWVSRKCINDSVAATGWIYLAGANAPDYVIVMRNAAGDIVPPAQGDIVPANQQIPPPSPSDVQLPECGA